MRDRHSPNPRFLVLLLLVVAMALFGCSKQETPSPTPTPTPTPPPVVTGNRDCVGEGTGNEKCKLTTDQVEAESAMAGHSCNDFDEGSAIHITKGTAGSGKFKKIHIKKDHASPGTFTIKVEPCPGSTGNPFPHANKPNNDNWESGDLDPRMADKSRYHLTMTKKSKKAGSKAYDPHIVIENR